jgi:hypothetical protein
MMKSASQMAVTLGLSMMAFTGVAIAGPMGTTGSFSLTRVDALKGGSGGEFTVYNIQNQSGLGINNDAYSATAPTKNVPNPFPSGTPIENSFQTFCLEQSEDAIMTGTNYFVVGSAASAGGGGSIGGQDPISKGTAWLYSLFAKGELIVPSTAFNLAGNYFSSVAPARKTEADYLQRAIWWLEEESPGDPTLQAKNPYYQAALAHFADQAGGAKAHAREGFLGVYVLNNFRSELSRNKFVTEKSIKNIAHSERGQDFLIYYVPDGGSTAMLLGGALMALGALRRRRPL